VRDVCGSYASAEAVRAVEDDPTGYSNELWKQLAELDLIGLMLPAEFGGSGMSALEGAVLYEEFGRSLAPSPHFVSAVMSAGVLLRAGSDAQKQAWLPRVATGDAVLTTAWLEPRHGFGPQGVQTTARLDGDHFVLDGTKWHVPFASAADQFVVLARTADGVDLFLVDPAAAGVTLTQQLTIASDAQYEIELVDVSVPAESRIGAAGSGWATWHDTMLEGIVLLAAYAIGGARFALDMTVQYAKDRQQFDKPLGAFQAIAHYLADASTAVEGGTILVHEAAWALANGRSIARLAPMAKLFACQTFRDVTAMGHQVHGGMGFTVECDMQLYFRRAKELQISWWNDRYLEELVAAETLDRDDYPPVRH
ncbi:MAG TPA: acyl-CoA dehydrogenase family protein, partial [Acidimicrobiia bacterium]|nr:acyl-CoA dehydrogenase family protein [Acidimicrobiia bacterium]